MAYEKEPSQDIEISNPVLGRLAAKGVRISDMIGLLTFVGVISVGSLAWMTLDAVGQQFATAAKSTEAIGSSIRQNAVAQRLMACIISMPQERREQEFTQPNSFCRRMAE